MIPTREMVSLSQDGALLIVTQGLVGLCFLLVHRVAGGGLLGVSLSPSDYALVVALLGLFNVLGLGASAVQVVAGRAVALEGEGAAMLPIARLVWRWGGALLAVWWLVVAVTPPLVPGASRWALATTGVVAFVGLFAPVLHGGLIGLRRFGWYSVSGLTQGVGRLGLVALATWLFAATSSPEIGVMSAVLVASVAGTVVALWPLRHVSSLPSGALKQDGLGSEVLVILIGQGALFLILNLDLVFAPRLFSGEELGAFSKAAMLSRLVLFLPLPIATAMFPRASRSAQPWIVVLPLTVAAVCGAVVASAIAFRPRIPLQLLYSVSDTLHTGLAAGYVWAAAPLGLCSVASQYLWARGEGRRLIWLCPIAVLYCLKLISAGANSEPVTVIWWLAVAAGSSCMVLVAGVARSLYLASRMPPQ